MTTLLVAFAAVLLLAVLLSSLAHRTVLSTAVVFLVAGFVLGDGVTGVLAVQAGDPVVKTLAELALFAVLFTDGMRVGWADLRSAWRLPGRALGWGLPLTLVITAVLAHFLVGLGWAESLLIGAVLAPTDPVFAAALVGNERVPPRLRHLLNVESGVNDGLALPFVVVLLAVAAGSDDLHLGELSLELAVGIVIGVLVPLVAIRLERSRFLSASTAYEPLNAIAIGLLVLALGKATHGNLFLAAFAAGITVASLGERQRESFEEFGELIAELLKLAALLVFGALITPSLLAEPGWAGWLFALLALVAARPIAIWVSFLGSRLGRREQLAVMWFGPKGFASVVYGLLVLESGITEAEPLFALVAVTIAISILAHSSTDIVVARSFDDEYEVPAWFGKVRDRLPNRGDTEPPATGRPAEPAGIGLGPGHAVGSTAGTPRAPARMAGCPVDGCSSRGLPCRWLGRDHVLQGRRLSGPADGLKGHSRGGGAGERRPARGKRPGAREAVGQWRSLGMSGSSCAGWSGSSMTAILTLRPCSRRSRGTTTSRRPGQRNRQPNMSPLNSRAKRCGRGRLSSSRWVSWSSWA